MIKTIFFSKNVLRSYLCSTLYDNIKTNKAYSFGTKNENSLVKNILIKNYTYFFTGNFFTIKYIF